PYNCIEKWPTDYRNDWPAIIRFRWPSITVIDNNLGLDLIYDSWVEVVSLKTGIDPSIIEQLGKSLADEKIELLFEFSVAEWIGWFLDWLKDNELRIVEMFPGLAAQAQLARVLGLKVTTYKLSELAENITAIKPILIAYVAGENYQTVNNLIPGTSDVFLTKARNFILRLVPQISFAISAVSLTLKEQLLLLDYEPDDIPFLVRNLASMVREGLDTQEKLQYKMDRRAYLRVQIHDALDI
ncbi:hypothetical protein, partial [Pedobacter hartonius]